MQLKISPDYDTLSAQVAEEVISLVKNKPDAVLCLASGDTPRLACTMIAESAVRENLNFSQVTFIGLDEWLGIPPENKGSCQFFFRHLILEPLKFSPSQINLFDALPKSPQEECRRMDKMIFAKGGIDLMIVGIGMNGHIGFNEPGTSFDNYSHVADLDETTTLVGQKYFPEPVKLRQGITLGLKHLMESTKLILMANGRKKAEVIQKAMEGRFSNQFPASIIQQHPNCTVMVDEEAASLLNKST